MGLWGSLGYPGGSNNFFFKHGHVAYQIDVDDEQNKVQVTFSSWGQTDDLGARSKGQISLTCQFHSCIHVQSVVRVKQSPYIMEANSKRSLVWC